MSEKRTRQQVAYDALRADVLSGRLEPGQKLPFAEMCERYGTSVGVIREALTRLVGEGLVQSVPQIGFTVTPLSRSDLLWLTDARCEIEILTLRRAIRDGDVTWESSVLAIHHQLERCPQMDPDDPARFNERWAQLHASFHETLLAGCENPRLRRTAYDLRAAAELYRRWSVPLGHSSDRDIAKEHRDIVEAVLARDTELAAALLHRHISLTTEFLLSTDSSIAD
ncbi:GntR family transcriptional regulator [Rhodococcus sp. IEGM 1307]|jgi:DNA-binding GntR family transcriptional regulator|uniref:GntR family transcriptional regulator n=1 Tax=Rhodococcus sp. IEGM 1307 TaxID=3047091 RepID=UPI001063AB95|nr:GntR family transcriptional regulator [Rhodococcus sp. IEGM 1307]MDI9979452.1 GntR family transcriptional regulator [Rhodococcus sp. IEGM 1307]